MATATVAVEPVAGRNELDEPAPDHAPHVALRSVESQHGMQPGGAPRNDHAVPDLGFPQSLATALLLLGVAAATLALELRPRTDEPVGQDRRRAS